MDTKIFDNHDGETNQGESIKEYEGIAPSTESQREIWSLVVMGSEASCSFNMSVSIHLKGNPDIDILRQAFTLMGLRHEALRMTFDGSGLTVFIHKNIPAEVMLIDLSSISEDGSSMSAESIVRQEMSTPFDLVRGPLWRAKIIKNAVDSYTVLVVAHHIICDGWSLSVIRRELRFLYGELKCGRKVNDTVVSRFSVYAEEMARIAQTNEYLQDEQYWLHRFAAGAPVNELPCDRERPSVRTFNAEYISKTIPPDIALQLKKFAKTSGISLFSFLFAAYCIWVRRLSECDAVVLGIPLAGQPLSGENDLVGHCVNFLPVYQDVPLNITVEDFLQKVSDTLLDAHDHRLCTFGGLLNKLKLPRDPGRIPLVSLCFTYIPYSHKDIESFHELETTYSSNPKSYETFEMNIDISDIEGRLDLHCNYNSNLYKRNTVERFLEYFETILLFSSQHPSCVLGAIPLMKENEWNKVVIDWNDTCTALPFETTLNTLFCEQVVRTPDALAVVYEESRLSYRELDNWSNSIAHILTKHGAGPGSLVALCAERSLEMVAGLMGILKAGAAYVPVDPSYPKTRIDYILNDADPPVLLTGRSFIGTIAPRPSMFIQPLEDTFNLQESASAPCVTVTPQDIAYVIYTSGSTGEPKGVMIPHRGICNRLLWMQNEFVLTEKDRILQKTPYTFDVSVWEFFWPLITGATLVMARPRGHQDAAYIADIIQNAQITVIHFVPSMLNFFIEEKLAQHCDSLRYVICSGEALTRAQVKKFFVRMPQQVRLYNLYGPTEASVDVSFWECERNEFQSGVPIGRPIANTQLFVLNEFRQPVPVGISGELYIGGVGLAREYLNKKDLTLVRFVPNPFSREFPGMGDFLYKTGDVARWRSDGVIEYLGRLDFQVKIRGFRIELGEIEQCMGKIDGVVECAALALDDSSGNKTLFAYMVANPAAGLTAKKIRDHLQGQLPEYMIPSRIYFLDHLPQTTSGKLDRKSLALYKDSSDTADVLVVHPGTPTQQVIAQIWAQELNRSHISVTDNFFDIGGHSLLLAKINNQLKERYGSFLSMVVMFQYPTIATLAEFIDNRNVKNDTLPEIARRAQLQRNSLKKKVSGKNYS